MCRHFSAVLQLFFSVTFQPHFPSANFLRTLISCCSIHNKSSVHRSRQKHAANWKLMGAEFRLQEAFTSSQTNFTQQTFILCDIFLLLCCVLSLAGFVLSEQTRALSAAMTHSRMSKPGGMWRNEQKLYSFVLRVVVFGVRILQHSISLSFSPKSPIRLDNRRRREDIFFRFLLSLVPISLHPAPSYVMARWNFHRAKNQSFYLVFFALAQQPQILV